LQRNTFGLSWKYNFSKLIGRIPELLSLPENKFDISCLMSGLVWDAIFHVLFSHENLKIYKAKFPEGCPLAVNILNRTREMASQTKPDMRQLMSNLFSSKDNNSGMLPIN
jgi:hypothetical protein